MCIKYDDCPGCSCHINPPCSHCVEDHNDLLDEDGNEIDNEARITTSLEGVE